MPTEPASTATAFELPPLARNAAGELRRVGFEFEFISVSPRRTAELVQARFGGTLHEIDPYWFAIEDAAGGNFKVELDTQYAHKDPERDAPETSDQFDRFVERLETELRLLVGVIGENFLPLEIVTPPLPMDRLEALEPLLDDLREAGAQGTEESPFYAFGLHLNPEAARLETGWLLAVLRAFLLLEEWLREEVDPHIARRILPFSQPFSPHYAELVVDPDYAPDMTQLIDDYLHANPSRNRDLDMLPLFAHLDRDRVRAAVSDDRVQPRPTFHYRLPDFRLKDPDWSLAQEWNRWVLVERLADEPLLLAEMGEAYLRHRWWLDGAWAKRVREFISE
jgi:hypothetical protein